MIHLLEDTLGLPGFHKFEQTERYCAPEMERQQEDNLGSTL